MVTSASSTPSFNRLPVFSCQTDLLKRLRRCWRTDGRTDGWWGGEVETDRLSSLEQPSSNCPPKMSSTIRDKLREESISLIKNFIVRRNKGTAVGQILLTPQKAIKFWLMAGAGSKPILRFYIPDSSYLPTPRTEHEEMINIVMGAGGRVEVSVGEETNNQLLPYASSEDREKAHTFIRQEEVRRRRRTSRSAGKKAKATFLIV